MIYSNRKFNPAAFSQRKLVAGIAAPPIIRMRSFPRHRGLGNHVQSIIKITADRGKDRSKAESRNTIEDDLSGGWALAGNSDGSLSNEQCWTVCLILILMLVGVRWREIWIGDIDYFLFEIFSPSYRGVIAISRLNYNTKFEKISHCQNDSRTWLRVSIQKNNKNRSS